jgi:hypothetical protein
MILVDGPGPVLISIIMNENLALVKGGITEPRACIPWPTINTTRINKLVVTVHFVVDAFCVENPLQPDLLPVNSG